jgi:rhodanese-related sulfurtransferase
MQLTPSEVAEDLASPATARLLDVRSREEHEAVHIPGSEFMGQELMQSIFAETDKAQRIILYCHQGDRSLDLAAYFRGHGFTETFALAGGIDAWSCQIDPSLPRYQLALD